MKYICMFSGGKDSTAMLHELIRRDYPLDYKELRNMHNYFPEIWRKLENDGGGK